MQAIITKYLGATNSNGSRIKAKCAAKSIWFAYDHSLSSSANHAEAARTLAASLHWVGAWVAGDTPDGTGNVYVNARSNAPAFELLHDGEA